MCAPVLLWSPHWNIPRVCYCEISCVMTEKSTLFYKTPDQLFQLLCVGGGVRRVLPRVRGWVTPLLHSIYAAGPAKRQGLGVGSAGSQRRNGCVIMLLRYHDDSLCENPTVRTSSYSPATLLSRCPMCILVLQIICEAHTKMLPDGRFTVSRRT